MHEQPGSAFSRRHTVIRRGHKTFVGARWAVEPSTGTELWIDLLVCEGYSCVGSFSASHSGVCLGTVHAAGVV